MALNAYLWRRRHVGSHHTFPNVQGGDADMDDNPFLRVTASSPAYGAGGRGTAGGEHAPCIILPRAGHSGGGRMSRADNHGAGGAAL